MSTLTVASFNLYGSDFRQEERAPLVVQQLLDLRPDVIGVQEINLTADRGNWICHRFNGLCREAGSAEYRIYHMANPGREVARGALGIMTRLPALFHDGLDYLIEELDWNRVAHRVRVEVSGTPVDFYNTHFHYQLDDAAQRIRQQQAISLLGWMDAHGWTIPKVLVGDFNAWPDSEPVRILKERLHSAYETVHGKEPPKTWPTPLVSQPNAPEWTLDYIFVTDEVNVLDARVVFDQPAVSDPTLYPSDHFGLMARLRIG